jgi:hypothetical protein
MKILRIVLAAFLVEAASAQQASPSLDGVVVRAQTNDPLAGVAVEVRTDFGTSVSMITDERGRFSLPNVRPGHYRLLATRQGFVRFEYGEGSASRGLTVRASERLPELRIPMTPGGVITGRVIDRGKPVPDVVVSAVKVSYEPNGRQVWKKVISAGTNDLGEYHLFWLPPGRYKVQVELTDVRILQPPMIVITPGGGDNPLITQGRDGLIATSRTGSPGEPGLLFSRSIGSGLASVSDAEMHVLKFHPDTTNWSDATEIEISPGAEIRNVDINANPVPALHVRGTVTGALPLNPQGQPGRPQIALIRSEAQFLTGLTAVTDNVYGRAPIDPNGSFDVARIQPGSYWLYAASLLGSVPIGTTIAHRIPVEIRDRDVSVNVPVVAGLTLSGRVVLEQPEIGIGNLTLELKAESGFPSTNVRPAADGTFTITGVFPAENYRLFVRPLSPPPGSRPVDLPPALQDAYVKSITMGSVDVLNDGLHLANQFIQSLVITIGTDAGSVEGNVASSRQPVPGATVVLIPESGQRFQVSHKLAYADDSGSFQIKAVPPGDYKLYAWESVEPGAWQNADFVRSYESQGKLVHIGEGAKMSGIELQSSR